MPLNKETKPTVTVSLSLSFFFSFFLSTSPSLFQPQPSSTFKIGLGTSFVQEQPREYGQDNHIGASA